MTRRAKDAREDTPAGTRENTHMAVRADMQGKVHHHTMEGIVPQAINTPVQDEMIPATAGRSTPPDHNTLRATATAPHATADKARAITRRANGASSAHNHCFMNLKHFFYWCLSRVLITRASHVRLSSELLMHSLRV